MEGARLRNSELSDANLSGANLRYADLRGSYLVGATLRDADLHGVKLEGAFLRGRGSTDMRNAKMTVADYARRRLQCVDIEAFKDELDIIDRG